MKQKKSPEAEYHALSIVYGELKESYYALKYLNEKGFAEQRTEKLFKAIERLLKQFEKLPCKVKNFACED
jgi:hypothetical protein